MPKVQYRVEAFRTNTRGKVHLVWLVYEHAGYGDMKLVGEEPWRGVPAVDYQTEEEPDDG